MTLSPQLRAGWLPATSLCEFIEQHEDVFGRLTSVLISSVDSDPRVATMPWAQDRIVGDESWAQSQYPLIISGRALLQLCRDSVFHGFDEIWIPAALPIPVPPGAAYLVSPRRCDGPLIPNEISDWMMESRARLGLGDGEGLNFVSSDRELEEELNLPL